MSEYILEVRNLKKYYAGVKALDDVSVVFREGEVHALVGENGAGKSTLIKVITGAIEPTAGEIVINGEIHKSLSPIWALHHGIAAIYQEFSLIPHLSIAENIFLGKEKSRYGFVDKRAMNEEASKILQGIGIQLNPSRQISDLGVAHQQIVEISKAVAANSRVLIMDEPTAPLTNNETKILFQLIDRLKKKHVTIIFITHRMEEMYEICDTVTIMRDGKHIITRQVEGLSRKQLISYMVGHEMGENYPSRKQPLGKVIFSVNQLSNPNVHDISFNLHKGEIIGIGGLVGAGRTEMVQAIFGADRISSGTIILNGQKVSIKSPGSALSKGIGLIPEDRKNQGVLLGLSVRYNVSFSALRQAMRGPFIDKKKDILISTKFIDKLRIKTPSISQLVKNLSGGNQQKVVLAKILASDCDIIIFDEPTRGIDVGAKQEIYQLMRDIVDVEGKSIIMVSSEMSELFGMSDRILVMRSGRIVGELKKEDFKQELLLEYASGMMGESEQ